MKFVSLQNLEQFWDKLKGMFVHKEDGKGLSTNDLTDSLKSKYDDAYTHSQAAHSPDDAEKNIIEKILVNGEEVDPVDRLISLDIPTKIADLEDDAGIVIEHQEIETDDDTEDDASPGYGTTFNAVDDVERDEFGHVLTINTKTITLPDGYDHPTPMVEDVYPFTEDAAALRGDVNGDGTVDADDLQLLEDYLEDPETVVIDLYNADVDGNGVINQDDYDLLNKYLEGLGGNTDYEDIVDAWDDPEDWHPTPESSKTPGTYRQLVINSLGHVIAAKNPTTRDEYGLTDVPTNNELNIALAEAIVDEGHLKFLVVDELPVIEEADELTIYLILKDDPEGTNNIYHEYLVVDGAYEKIGEAVIDLSKYYEKSDISFATDDEIDDLMGISA